MFRKKNSLPTLHYERLKNMRTTIYSDTLLLEKLKAAMDEVGLSKDALIQLLVTRIITKNRFVPMPCKAVKYQSGGPERVWKTEHINLEPEFYEKALDLRRHCKFSVSWFVAFAIVNYLDELVNELKNSGNSENILDNYVSDYAYISEMVVGYRVFLTIMDTQSKKT
jgi:hypothetical protein